MNEWVWWAHSQPPRAAVAPDGLLALKRRSSALHQRLHDGVPLWPDAPRHVLDGLRRAVRACEALLQQLPGPSPAMAVVTAPAARSAEPREPPDIELLRQVALQATRHGFDAEAADIYAGLAQAAPPASAQPAWLMLARVSLLLDRGELQAASEALDQLPTEALAADAAEALALSRALVERAAGRPGWRRGFEQLLATSLDAETRRLAIAALADRSRRD